MADSWYLNSIGSGTQFLSINGVTVEDNDKVVVGMYSNQPNDNVGTFDFYQGDFGLLETTGAMSNYIFLFIKSTDELSIEGDLEEWVNSNLTGFYYLGDFDDDYLDNINSSYTAIHTNQLSSLEDYSHFIGGCKLMIMGSGGGTIAPENTLNLVGGSSTVEVSYETNDDYTVSPSSPITVGSSGVNLIVSLIDGYKWSGDSQVITIDSNEISGTVDGTSCTFELTTANVGSGGSITWGLHYSPVTPPSEDRIDFFTIYEPTNKNMETINNAIFIKDLSSGETANVLQYFSSYKKFFCNIPITGYKQLKGGRYDFGETAPYVKEHTMIVDCGSIDIEETFQSLLDYSPFSRLTIYLPFIGFEDLDDKLVMGHKLSVQYVVDILSGRCLAQLYVDSITPKSCIAEYGGTIAADEIFSSNNGMNYYGTYELMTTLQLGELNCYVLIHTKIPLEDSIADYEGLPTNEIIKVGDAVGFIKYSSIHVDGITATDVEKSEIESLLKSGIIV